LSSHGYTFVAKAMMQVDRAHLLQEANVYSKLHLLQGSCIPVCLGTVDLVLPYYYDFGVYASILVLSWAGYPLHRYLNWENQVCMLDEVRNTLIACHKHGVLHKDAEPRNWLWDGQRIMLIDFERAEIRAGELLQVISPNRKRVREGDIKGMMKDEFALEIRRARGALSRCIR
jgi:serine/threonine protein kinase